MIEEMYKEEFGDDASELLTSKSPNSTNQEDSSSQQQQQQENTTNVAFSSEPKPDCTQANEDDPQLHQMNRSGDYDTLMNYQGYDYRYIDGNNQQESRFSSGQHLHDFVV